MRGVLFDLDGTLLDIDLDTFLRSYFAALGPVVASVIDTDDHGQALAAVMRATQAMMQPHPGRTNQAVFESDFREATGVEILRHATVLEEFYAEVFPTLGEGIGPHAGARDAVETALGLGLEVAVATNPIFPAAAVRERIRWAGLADVPFGLVTTYEHMHACKPLPEYFREAADLLGLAPHECIMVGDDPSLDMPASDVGMFTFYVGRGSRRHGCASGDLGDLAKLLPSLALA